jgi:hypothetical protein
VNQLLLEIDDLPFQFGAVSGRNHRRQIPPFPEVVRRQGVSSSSVSDDAPSFLQTADAADPAKCKPLVQVHDPANGQYG